MTGLQRPGRRSFEWTPIDRTRIHGATALLAALAAGLLPGPDAVAQTSPAIEQITAEANARSAAGMPDAEVEAWIDQAMQQAGLTVRKPPENWDVYGQARWERELAQEAAAQAPELSAPPTPQADAGAASDEPRYGDPQHGNDIASAHVFAPADPETVTGTGLAPSQELQSTDLHDDQTRASAARHPQSGVER